LAVVIDANVAVDWFLPSRSRVSDLALDALVVDGAIVPALWRWEVQDVLRRLDLNKRLTQSPERVRLELRELPIVVDSGLTSVFGGEAALADRYGLSVYDAAYLELALRVGAPLATNDSSLATAAKAAGLESIS
jgi:predicted nucleic acid-binding protein